MKRLIVQHKSFRPFNCQLKDDQPFNKQFCPKVILCVQMRCLDPSEYHGPENGSRFEGDKCSAFLDAH